ncbi:hypothetical protein NCCP2222_20640 [Sporosarcina sp. NCCP-2222]|uniref:hypothetical protein n=1 Tax=Sporosarcina sp. NCCP-2222 TaxID=2935073 RepID=UPI0020841ECD|nr:hypothetical protein [Sporosarcina sp. NCCP-2222]GKV56117.1 hypothetical protein NCCP2222_20640 [Sporosarcina sp. NCCP-2222]
MVKPNLILLVCLGFVFIWSQNLTSEAHSEAEEMYVTTEDIIADIVFPIIDKRVIQEYGGDPLLGWDWKRIEGVTYNDNHTYDVTVRIQIPSENHLNTKEDLVMVRISPSCNSGKINQLKCNHGFKVEVVDYKHLSP